MHALIFSHQTTVMHVMLIENQSSLHRLQWVSNTDGQLLTGTKKYDNITTSQLTVAARFILEPFKKCINHY